MATKILDKVIEADCAIEDAIIKNCVTYSDLGALAAEALEVLDQGCYDDAFISLLADIVSDAAVAIANKR